jgi:hypothetical protein
MDRESGASSNRMTQERHRPAQPAITANHGARPTHSEDGVDLTVIRWMLSLTPAKRLQVLQQTIRSIVQLRGDIKP